jgi:hypothetical protein
LKTESEAGHEVPKSGGVDPRVGRTDEARQLDISQGGAMGHYDSYKPRKHGHGKNHGSKSKSHSMSHSKSHSMSHSKSHSKSHSNHY